MTELSTAKKPGDLIRVLHKEKTDCIIENDWSFVRFEPDSGNLIAEKNNKRIVCPRQEYDCLNFPGSENVWNIISTVENDENIARARDAWSKLDASGLTRALINHIRSLDPRLAGAQTVSDLIQIISELRETCLSSMDVLRLNIKRAEAEYKHCPNRTLFESDQKDTLLERLHDLQNRYAARQHYHEKIIPVMSELVSALENIKDISKHCPPTSP